MARAIETLTSATSHKEAQRVLTALAAACHDAPELLNLAAQALPEWKIRHINRGSQPGVGYGDWKANWRINGRRHSPRTGIAHHRTFTVDTETGYLRPTSSPIVRFTGNGFPSVAKHIEAILAAPKQGERCPMGGLHTWESAWEVNGIPAGKKRCTACRVVRE